MYEHYVRTMLAERNNLPEKYFQRMCLEKKDHVDGKDSKFCVLNGNAYIESKEEVSR